MLITGIDWENYERIFSNAVGSGSALTLFDFHGEVLWTSSPDTKAQLNAILEVLKNSSEYPFCLPQKDLLDLGKEGKLAIVQLEGTDSDPGILLAALLPESCASYDVGETSFLLKEIASAALREKEAAREIQSLALELSGRYDELNLFYSLATTERFLDDLGSSLRNIVELCCSYLNVDLAFFHSPYLPNGIFALSDRSKRSLVRLKTNIEMARSLGQKGLADFPLLLNGEKVGAFDFSEGFHNLIHNLAIDGTSTCQLVVFRETDKGVFETGDKRLLETLGTHAAMLIKEHNLFEGLRKFTEQVVESFVSVVEAKDIYTKGHSDRVNTFAMALGRKVGLPEKELKDLYWASILHDLGKIAVPDSILCKPSSLTDPEYMLMQTHSELGHKFLSPVENLKEALAGILHHHERYDGHGYPYQIGGADIPLLARIISVADTYDALTSCRAYRDSRSHLEAMEEIKKVAGTQLDPHLVSVWCELVEQLPELCQQVDN